MVDSPRVVLVLSVFAAVLLLLLYVVHEHGARQQQEAEEEKVPLPLALCAPQLQAQLAQAELLYQEYKVRARTVEHDEFVQGSRSNSAGLAHSLSIWRWFPVTFPVVHRRVGAFFDGGKYSASIATLALAAQQQQQQQHQQRRRCVVYSFGSNRQVDFELGVLREAPQCEVHIFDYTVSADAMPREAMGMPQVHFHQEGLSDRTGWVGCSRGQCRIAGLYEFMRDLNHTYVDIVKMDVEFAEYTAMKSVFLCDAPATAPCHVPFGEVMMELHVKDRNEHAQIFDLFDSFEHAGFRHFSAETNFGVIEPYSGVEVCWIHKDFCERRAGAVDWKANFDVLSRLFSQRFP